MKPAIDTIRPKRPIHPTPASSGSVTSTLGSPEDAVYNLVKSIKPAPVLNAPSTFIGMTIPMNKIFKNGRQTLTSAAMSIRIQLAGVAEPKDKVAFVNTLLAKTVSGSQAQRLAYSYMDTVDPIAGQYLDAHPYNGTTGMQYTQVSNTYCQFEIPLINYFTVPTTFFRPNQKLLAFGGWLALPPGASLGPIYLVVYPPPSPR